MGMILFSHLLMIVKQDKKTDTSSGVLDNVIVILENQMQHDNEHDGGNDSGHNDGDDHESDDDGDASSDCSNIIPLFGQNAVQLQYSAKSPTWQKS